MSSFSSKPTDFPLPGSALASSSPTAESRLATPAQKSSDPDCLFSTEWQPLYLAAMLEIDQRFLFDAIGVAEVALFRRMKTIFYSAEHGSERLALEQAWSALQQRKQQCQGCSNDNVAQAA